MFEALLVVPKVRLMSNWAVLSPPREGQESARPSRSLPGWRRSAIPPQADLWAGYQVSEFDHSMGNLTAEIGNIRVVCR